MKRCVLSPLTEKRFLELSQIYNVTCSFKKGSSPWQARELDKVCRLDCLKSGPLMISWPAIRLISGFIAVYSLPSVSNCLLTVHYYWLNFCDNSHWLLEVFVYLRTTNNSLRKISWIIVANKDKMDGNFYDIGEFCWEIFVRYLLKLIEQLWIFRNHQ